MKKAPGASARANLHDKMLRNLFQCPIDLFEAYPIGRILNRLSCDMYVIDQVCAHKKKCSIWITVHKIYLIADKNSTSEAAFLRPKTGSRIAHLPLLNCGQLYSGERENSC